MSIRATILGCLACVGIGLAAPAMPQDRTAQQDWLAAHNAERAQFGVPPLHWSNALERDARIWARRIAEDGVMQHSAHGQRYGAGENLWMGTAGYYTPQQMIRHFADEKQDFVAGSFPNVSRTGNWGDVGHFTQIVWGDTREVGCALAHSERYDFLVCRYWPAGNVMGEEIAPRRASAR